MNDTRLENDNGLSDGVGDRDEGRSAIDQFERYRSRGWSWELTVASQHAEEKTRVNASRESKQEPHS